MILRLKTLIVVLVCSLSMVFAFGGLISVRAAESFHPANVMLQEVYSGFASPIFITNAGDGSGRLFVVERAGRIRIIEDDAVLPAPFLDIQSIVNSSGGEQGLLALAFHPNYESNGLLYTMHTASDRSLVLARFGTSSGDPNLADPDSMFVILTIPHPGNSNHNGGTLAFGPDGYLYWSTGDGGGGGDVANNAQNRTMLLGKLLRLDVDSGSPYEIPPGNPFFNDPDDSIRKEIWAYGFRNPWRFSFDRDTGDIYVGDVGQGAREEIDYQPAGSTGGENYGWRVMEGSLCFSPSSNCDTNAKVLPVAEYSHGVGCSVTGGYVYRGTEFPLMEGVYFYGDFCSGILYGLQGNPHDGWTATSIVDSPYLISTFGEDEAGELYLTNYGMGKIFQIVYHTFADVPRTHMFWSYIEGFYNTGITTGCGNAPLQYCPNNPVSRASMAVFVLRAKYGSGHVPDPGETDIFDDLPIPGREWMQPWVEEFYEEGITTGCGADPLRFCPENTVSRGSMAVFLLRAKYGLSYTPPPAYDPPLFADVPVTGKEWMQPWIEAFYNEGYTTGCAAAPLRFCPEGAVTRGSMAVFISRVFSAP